MNNMKHLRFDFENCESITINGYITYEKVKNNLIDNVVITIPKSENGVNNSNFGYDNDDTTKFARLKRCNDICCICINDDEYVVKWGDNDYGQTNSAQSYHYENNNLVIKINTKKAELKKRNQSILDLFNTYLQQNNLSFYDGLKDIKNYNNENEIIEFFNDNVEEENYELYY